MAVIQQIEAGRRLSKGSRPSTRIDTSSAQAGQNLGNSLRGFGSTVSSIALRSQNLDQQDTLANENLDQQIALRKERNDAALQGFTTDQEFRRFQQSEASAFTDTANTSMAPNGAGFAEAYSKDFAKRASDFLASVPPAQLPKIQERLATYRQGQILRAAQTQRAKTDEYVATGIQSASDNAAGLIAQDPGQYDVAVQDINQMIDEAPWSDARKSVAKKSAEKFLLSARAETYLRENPAVLTGDQGTNVAGSAKRMATKLIKGFEGFRTGTYWDVNAHRLGYGSDTITLPNGTVKRVRKGDKVSRADADRDLARRSEEFASTAAEQIGGKTWGALPANVQAGLTSVAYNYGSLPSKVVSAARTGNPAAIAQAVAGLSGDNKGINRKRRMQEAAVINGGKVPDVKGGGGDGELYLAPETEGLPFAERLKFYDQAVSAVDANAREQKARDSAEYSQHLGGVKLGIETGEVSSERQILDDNILTDADKATQLKGFRTKSKENADVSALVEQLQADDGSAGRNVFDSSDRKVVDKAYDQTVAKLPEEKQQAFAGEVIRQTGVVPQTVVADTRKLIESRDVAEVQRGLSVASNIEGIRPNSLAARSGGEAIKKDVAVYEAALRRGATPEEAAQRVMDMRDPEKVKARQATLSDKETKKWVADQTTESALRDEFDQVFGPGGNPQIGAGPAQRNAILGDYRVMLEDALLETPDRDAAKDIALSRFREIYDVSSLNVQGERVLMRHPPEKSYPSIGGSHDYLMKSLKADLKGLGIEAENVYLVASKDTDAAKGRNPSVPYNVMYEDENRVLQTLPDPFFLTGDELRKMEQADASQRRAAIKRAEKQYDESLSDTENVELEAQRAFEETDGPNWMKVRAAQAARDKASTKVEGEYLNLGVIPEVRAGRERGAEVRAQGRADRAQGKTGILQEPLISDEFLEKGQRQAERIEERKGSDLGLTYEERVKRIREQGKKQRRKK